MNYSLRTARKAGPFGEDRSCFACYGVSFISRESETQQLKVNSVVKSHYRHPQWTLPATQQCKTQDDCKIIILWLIRTKSMIILPDLSKTYRKYKINTLKHIIMFYPAEWSTKLPDGASNATLQYYLPLTAVFQIRGKWMRRHSKQNNSDLPQKVLLFELFEGCSSSSLYFSLKSIIFIHLTFRGNL